MATKKFFLMSNDGEVFEVDSGVIRLSTTLNTMFQEAGGEKMFSNPIPLPNLNGAILRKVIAWCQHHKDDVPVGDGAESKERRTDDIWDEEFLKVEQGTLFELILAANYLDVRGLMDVACKTVANMIKGKVPGEIRRTWHVKNDFTPEEEEQIRRENAWCED